MTRGRRTSLWSGSALAALLLHGGVAAAMLMQLRWQTPDFTPPPAAMTVEIAELPAAPPTPPSEIPPGPRQVESKPAPRPRPKLQPLFDPPPKVETAPDLAVAQKKEDQDKDPQKDPPAPATTTPPTTQASIDKTLAAPAEGDASSVPSDAEQSWESRVLGQLNRNKRYPGVAQRMREEDTVYLRFTVDRGGKVLSYSIERSRGFAPLDEEALSLIRRSSPLPAPPKAVGGDRIELVVPVEFFLKNVKG